MKDDVSFYLFMTPFMLAFFLFTVIPIASSMVLSFFDYDMVSTPIFIGFENYIRMFTADDMFFTVLANSLSFGILVGPGGYLLAFLLAWMINEFPKTIRVLLTFIFYVYQKKLLLPHTLRLLLYGKDRQIYFPFYLYMKIYFHEFVAMLFLLKDQFYLFHLLIKLLP